MDEKLIERQSELIQIIEAIGEVLKSKDWKVVRETFEKLVESYERQLLSEAKRPMLEDNKIYFLQGQIATAKRYDLATYSEMLKKELQGIKENKQWQQN